MVEYHPYLFLAVFLGVAILFAIAPLMLAALWSKRFSPSKPGPDKNDVYECGLKSKGDAWIQFRSDYYIYAIIFLIFDVETIFLFPWAIIYKQLAVFGLIEMMVFLGILIVGYIWIIKKGALDWA